MGSLYQAIMPVTLATGRFNASGIGAYVDDTWKITPKVTITALRRNSCDMPELLSLG
jgi:hypothetical protein